MSVQVHEDQKREHKGVQGLVCKVSVAGGPWGDKVRTGAEGVTCGDRWGVLENGDGNYMPARCARWAGNVPGPREWNLGASECIEHLWAEHMRAETGTGAEG